MRRFLAVLATTHVQFRACPTIPWDPGNVDHCADPTWDCGGLLEVSTPRLVRELFMVVGLGSIPRPHATISIRTRQVKSSCGACAVVRFDEGVLVITKRKLGDYFAGPLSILEPIC